MFARYLYHVLIGLIAIAVLNGTYMKGNVKIHLRQCDRWESLAFILSFIPAVVQAALNVDNWCWRDLINEAASRLTGREGIYFGVGNAKNKLLGALIDLPDVPSNCGTFKFHLKSLNTLKFRSAKIRTLQV